MIISANLREQLILCRQLMRQADRDLPKNQDPIANWTPCECGYVLKGADASGYLIPERDAMIAQELAHIPARMRPLYRAMWVHMRDCKRHKDTAWQ